MAFQKFGSYSSTSSPADVYFPFRSLFTGKRQEDIEFNVENDTNQLIFKKQLPSSVIGYQVVEPGTSGNELTWVDPNGLKQTAQFLPITNIFNNTLQVIVPKIGGYISNEHINPADTVDEARKCNGGGSNQSNLKGGIARNEIMTEKQVKFIRLSALATNNCSVSLYLPNMPTKYSYLISINSRNVSGMGLYAWVENISNKKADIQTYLPQNKDFQYSTFIIPPMEKDGQGYVLHFDNISIDKDETTNDLAEINIIPIPYNYLANLTLQKSNTVPASTPTSHFTVSHPNPVFYQINISSNKASTQTLILSQSFDQGWIAFTPTGHFLNTHELINNWENGWVLPTNYIGTVYLFYLPQVIELFGLSALLFIIISFIYKALKRKAH